MKQVIGIFILLLSFRTMQSQNHSLDFDGVDDYVGVPHSANLYIGSNPYTVELWFKAPNANQLGSLIAKRQPTSPYNMANLNINDGSDPINSPHPGKKITFNFGTILGGPYRSITTINDIIDGNFHHIAAVVDPAAETIVLYVDGVLETVNTLSSGSFPSVTNTEQYTIGQANGNLDFYTGKIDEVRIWNVVRTQTEIQNNMNTELSGTESGLVSYWKMDITNSSCDIKDCNSNENHGTRNGSGGSNNLPQFATDIPSITDVACGASTSCTILPVELVGFSGRVVENQILLNWETASEINNSGFEIQKSETGKYWNVIDFTYGKETTSKINEYQYKDENPFSGINYYRLKQIDYDGALEFSKVIAVTYNPEKKIRVFPNPSNRLINIQIDNPSNQRMKVNITDYLGRKIWESELIEGEFNWRKRLELNGNGIYFITVQIGSETFYERVIILAKK